MPKYLTVNQYKRFGIGVSLDGVNVLNLTLAIAEAESGVDAHMQFDPKVGGFEPHTVWIEAAWHPGTLRNPFPSAPIPVRQIVRYRIQVSNLSTSGAGFFANINASDCVINEFDEYIEIVPLQAVTYSLSPVLLQLGLNPPIVQCDCEVGYYLPILGETLMNDGQNKTYYGLRGYWASAYTQASHVQPATLPPVPPVVYKDGAVVSNSLYSINYAEGSVTFTSANNNSNVVTADYTAQIPDYVYFATVEQTAFLLAQRELNRQGLSGLQEIKSGDTLIRRAGGRNAGASEAGRRESPLCEAAAQWLSHMVEIAVA